MRRSLFAAALIAVGCAKMPPEPAEQITGTWSGVAHFSTRDFPVVANITRVSGDSIFGECRLSSPTTCMLRGRVRGDSVTYTAEQVEDGPQHFRGVRVGSELRGRMAIGYCPGCPEFPAELTRQ